jgi:hypothetical protein
LVQLLYSRNPHNWFSLQIRRTKERKKKYSIQSTTKVRKKIKEK